MVQFARHYLAVWPKRGRNLLILKLGEAVTQFKFRAVLRKCLQFLGIQDQYISTYSFQIGAATEVFQEGMGVQVIKKLGWWDSDCFQ